MESLLPALALLACPVGMGVMMWFMSRGSRSDAAPTTRPAGEESLDDLRAEQRRLAAEIERLDGSQDERTSDHVGARS